MTTTEELRLAMSDIQRTLEGLVIGPPATSVPAMRARYQLTLVKEMVEGGDRPWFYYRTKLHDFDKRMAEKAKKVEKSAS